MSPDIETVEALVRIMEAHGLRRIEAGGIVLERDHSTWQTTEPKEKRDEEREPRKPIPPPGLGHYADESLWAEGEYPEELLNDDKPGASGAMR